MRDPNKTLEGDPIKSDGEILRYLCDNPAVMNDLVRLLPTEPDLTKRFLRTRRVISGMIIKLGKTNGESQEG